MSESTELLTTSGLRTDIEELFTRFDATDSLKFKAFTQCFRSMSFGLVFRGRQNDNEMREFIDDSYLEVLRQLVDKDKRLSHRICSLYLLYALYVKQPLDQSLKTRFDVKVRITLDQLTTIRAFVAECKRTSRLDVCYVWHKLVSIGVHFVYYRYQSFGPSNTRSVHYWTYDNSNSTADKAINALKKSVDSRLEILQANHDIYVDYKDKVFDDTQQESELKPNIIGHDLFQDSANKLTKLVAEFRGVAKRHTRGRGRPSTSTPYRSDANESPTRLNSSQHKLNVQKKAIKSKVKPEAETAANILWNQEVIHSLKKGQKDREKRRETKERTAKQPKQRTRK